MVKRFYPLMAVLGLVFMAAGAYIALAQDSSQTMTIAMSGVSNLALANEVRSTPNTQLVMTTPDGQAQQGSDLAQLITSNLLSGTYQLTVVKPDNSSRSYTFQVVDNQQIVIPVEWTVVTAPPVVIPPTDIPTQPPMPTAIILPTEIPTELPTVTPVILPTEIPTELPTATAVILPTDLPTEVLPTQVSSEPIEVTEAVIEPTQVVEATEELAVATQIVEVTEVLPTVVIEATEELAAPSEIIEPTQAAPQPMVQTPIVEQTEAVVEPTQALPQPSAPTQVMPQPTIGTPVVQLTQVVPTQVNASPTAVMTSEVIPTLASTATIEPSTPVPEILGQITGVVQYTALEKQVAIHLNLTRLDSASEIIEVDSDSTGAFQFADLPLGIYQLDASAPGFLSARLEVHVLDGQPVQLPPATLKVGDTNQDGLIDIKDVTLVAANFNGPAAVVEADINGDGWVDISDLSVVGSLFGLAGPLPWN